MGELAELWQRVRSRDLIHFGPALALSDALPRAAHRVDALPYPLELPQLGPSGTLEGASLVLTFSGTSALARCVPALGLAPGDRILCPSYNCGHELEPFLRAGLELAFYRVDARMQVDLEDLRRRLARGVRAVLATHYFGFAQPIRALRELCDAHGALLIEDCAHAFASRVGDRPLGSFGDAAAFSLRKSLPLPDGGALCWRTKDGAPRRETAPRCETDRSLAIHEEVSERTAARAGSEGSAPPRLGTAAKTLDLWQKHMMRASDGWRFGWTRAALALASPLLIARRVLPRLGVAEPVAWYDPDDERLDFDDRILGWGMSPVARSLLQQIDHRAVLERRRANYLRLCEQLAPVSDLLIHPELPRGVCPLHLPIAVEARASVASQLYERGITAGVWWDDFHASVPWDDFPEAVALKRSVLALPVHQDLESAQIDRLARELLSALGSCAGRAAGEGACRA